MDVDMVVKFSFTISGTRWCTQPCRWKLAKRCLQMLIQVHAQSPFPTSRCRKAIYWPSAEVSSSKVNLRPGLMRSLPLSSPLSPVSLALFHAERNSFTLQIQIYEQSGKMYSYHRWSYYRRGKLSNENIIHRKWHLNTYQQREKSNIICIIRGKQSDTIAGEMECNEKFTVRSSRYLCVIVIQFKPWEKSACCWCTGK